MSPQQKQTLYTEVAKLIEAGFGINDAAEALLEAGQDSEVEKVLEALKSSLKEGRTITESFAEGPMELLEMEDSIISAGEKGGRLAVSFQQLAEYFELLADSRKEIRRGFIYPTILFHLAVLLSVIPFSLLDGGMGKEGSEIIRDFIVKIAICYGIAFLIFLGIRALLKTCCISGYTGSSCSLTSGTYWRSTTVKTWDYMVPSRHFSPSFIFPSMLII